MTRGAYYNEFDPFAAAWLRELIAGGHIAAGEVDERSIVDVSAGDLAGFTQCHFFAGIGVWSYALRRAGWPDSVAVWTGSCPCQPFSASGQGRGFDDPRHLWPAWYRLIRECRPDVCFGEQVASEAGRAWLDVVSADLENDGYAIGPAILSAAGVGAPHMRQRLYWVADAGRGGDWQHARELSHDEGERGDGAQDGDYRSVDRGSTCGMADAKYAERRTLYIDGVDGRDGANGGRQKAYGLSGTRGEVCRLADTGRERCDGFKVRVCERESRPTRAEAERRDSASRMADADSARFGRRRSSKASAESNSLERPAGLCATGGECAGPTNGFWRNADWIFCTDGKWRAVEPGTQPLAHVASARVGRLRGYGNAINAETAVAFIEAYIETLQPRY